MTIQQFIPQSNILPSANFASFPAASGFPIGWRYRALDVGTHGSTWVNDGTAWQLDGGVANLFQNTLPMAIPPSGVITVGTGALTLGTALDNIYPSIYMWFPAGAWTGSTAGMYYVAMTSTTVGTVYSNQYTGGVATIPSSPMLVTTGAGAYVQTTGTALTLLSYTLPANVTGSSAAISSTIIANNNNSAGAKVFNWLSMSGYNSTTFSNTTTTNFTGASSTYIVGVNKILFRGTPDTLTASSIYLANQPLSVATPLWATGQLSVATDWLIVQGLKYQLSR